MNANLTIDLDPEEIVRHICKTMNPTVRDMGPSPVSDCHYLEISYKIDPKTFPCELWGTHVGYYDLSDDGTELITIDLD